MAAIPESPKLRASTFGDRPVGLSGWVLRLYPEAGEGGGCWMSGAPRKKAEKVIEVGDQLSMGLAGPSWDGSPVDPDRSMTEAGRRARGKIRRYGTANGLNRLGTLTYAGEGCHDEREFREHMGLFFRRLREGLGGDRFPYLWVPEWHPGGHGLHAHFVVGQYVQRGLIKEAWGRGRVHIKLIGDLPVGSSRFAEARTAAGYVAKYVGKDFGERKTGGLHRYEIAQGFQPGSVQLNARSVAEVLAVASERMGGRPRYVWESINEPGWTLPPALWAAW